MFHSSSVCSVRFPGGVNAQGVDILRWMQRLSEVRALRQKNILFPFTSSSNALEDELSCHRLAAGGGFGRPVRYLVHYIYSEELHHLPLPAAQMLTKMS